MLDFTVVIFTFNRKNLLPNLLNILANQKGIEGLKLEILVIDNNSTDGTGELLAKIIENWTSAIPIQYIYQPKQGIAYSRSVAVELSRSELVAFIDDDNIPDDYWVSHAYNYMNLHPKAAVISSQIIPQYEVPPSEDVKPFLFYLGTNLRGEKPFIYDFMKTGTPPGASVVVKRSLWLKYVPRNLFYVGRIHGSTVGGDDTEAFAYFQLNGWEIHYCPQMKINHYFPASRLEFTNLAALMWGVGLARYYLRMQLRSGIFNKLFYSVCYLVNDFYKLAVCLIFLEMDNRGDKLKAHLLAATFLSPFYTFFAWAKKFQYNLKSFLS